MNPGTTHTRFIIAHALLRDETYAGPLRDRLGDFAPASLPILDEAHNAAPASGAKAATPPAIFCPSPLPYCASVLLFDEAKHFGPHERV